MSVAQLFWRRPAQTVQVLLTVSPSAWRTPVPHRPPENRRWSWWMRDPDRLFNSRRATSFRETKLYGHICDEYSSIAHLHSVVNVPHCSQCGTRVFSVGRVDEKVKNANLELPGGELSRPHTLYLPAPLSSNFISHIYPSLSETPMKSVSHLSCFPVLWSASIVYTSVHVWTWEKYRARGRVWLFSHFYH